MINLSAAGLTATEAKCYTALLEQPDWKPAELAKYVNETRTNCYKLLDNLVAFNLAERFNKNKKLHYKACNPSQLLELARRQRIEREQAEKELEVGTESLLRTYVATTEQPGITYYNGKGEIDKIFHAIADSKEEVVFLHTAAGIDFYGFDTMHKLRMMAVHSKTPRRAITPDVPSGTKDFRITDLNVFLKRTWFKKDDYTAPVEWGAFEDKIYLISYGEEAMGLIIQNQQIADSFKQLFSLLERGQRQLPDYHLLPKNAQKPGRSD